MKKILITILFMVSIPLSIFAQGVLGRVRGKVEQRANQKVDQAIDKGLDKIEEGATQSGNTKEGAETKESKKEPSAQGETGQVVTSGSKTKEELPIKAYAQFDFVPGDSVLFEDAFRGESTDEIPALWVPTGGVVEITKINDQTVAGFLDGFYTGMYPRMKKYNYLPTRFSVEFDYLFQMNSKKKWGRFLADGGAAGLDVVFHSADIDAVGEELGDFVNNVRIESDGRIGFGDFRGGYKGITDIYADAEIYDKWVHISVSVTERGVKVYMNNQRILNAPVGKGKAASIGIRADGCTAAVDGYQMFVRNVRIAAGGKDPYKQITSSVKAVYIARGINFDYNMATLRPESMGELNKLSAMLKEHPELKFEIGGFTDSDGDDAYNLKLSQQRADAVKAKLIEMGTDASRLSAKGYGETKPLASNDTVEGKANNRRVEFSRK